MIMLEWRAARTIKKLIEEWKVQTLSREATARIDNELATALNDVKEDFGKKERASRKHILEIESTTAEK